MRSQLAFIASSLLFAAVAHAQATTTQPAPVRPIVIPATAYSTLVTKVRLAQDRCYAWGAPQVTRSGNTFAITQTVAARAQCPAPGTDTTDVELGRIPAGAYRLTYAPTAIGSPVFAAYAREFDVRDPAAPGGLGIRIEPARPTALEPVTAFVDLNTCELVTGFRMRNDALEVVTAIANVPCDAPVPRAVAIGSFPPGTYTVRAVRADGTVMSTQAFTVGPARTAATINEYPQELSGLWVSPDEEPGTAIAFINSGYNGGDSGSGRVNGLVGIWYRYDATGAPIWYYIETDTGGVAINFNGSVFRYAATNPGALPFQRTTAATGRGTVNIQLDALSGDLRLRGVVDGEAIDIPFRPFRYTRNAWSGGN